VRRPIRFIPEPRAEADHEDQGFHRRLPFRSLMLGSRQLHDVVAGILQRDELAAVGWRAALRDRGSATPSFASSGFTAKSGEWCPAPLHFGPFRATLRSPRGFGLLRGGKHEKAEQFLGQAPGFFVSLQPGERSQVDSISVRLNIP
jgi:hypothetical protein